MAVYSTPPYGYAGLDTGQDGMADPTGPSQRRRRDTAAVRLLVSRRWNRAFPEEWRRAGRESASAALADFRNSIGVYPSPADLATVEIPVVCTYGARSPDSMCRLVESLAAAIPAASTRRIEGAGHAAPFDAPSNFVQAVADTIR